MNVLCIFITLIVAVQAGYHDEIGIPLAARIKEYEDKLFDEVPDMESRIVGGEIAPVFAHPYMVGLIIRLDNHFLSLCGSSLVTSDRLVTAAHCIEWAESMKAVLGTLFLYRGGTRIITRNFLKHPRYDGAIDFDIGLVKLPYPIETSETLHPIRLPKYPEDEVVVGEWAVAAGWGLNSEQKRGKQKVRNLLLNEVRIQIINESVCEDEYRTYHVHGNTICTSGEGGVAVCDGDSGGPLVVERNRRKILVGIVSRGHYPCDWGLPSVFTKVQKYINFILHK